MAVNIRFGESDEGVSAIAEALERYQRHHPAASIDIYRYDRFSVRLRIIDPTFSKVDRLQRHDVTWSYLETLPEEVQADITVVVLLHPDEVEDSLGNFHFEHPVPLEHGLLAMAE